MVTAYREAINQAWYRANTEQREKAEKISQELYQKAAVQTRLAKYIACISPYANYIYLVTDLTGTGLRSMSYFWQIFGEFSEINRSYLENKIQDAREKDPTYNSNSFIDLSDRPRFQFREEPLSQKLTAVLPFWGFLIFFNVLFFVLSFVRFMRYDVR
jgi:hypothetical protein